MTAPDVLSLMTENAILRAENASLRTTIEAVRHLIGMVPTRAVPASVGMVVTETAATAGKTAAGVAAAAKVRTPRAPETATEDAPVVRFLADLRTYELAPRCASMKRDGKFLPPYWMPKTTPHVTDLVRSEAVAWRARPGIADEPGIARLDRSGAHVSSASTVYVAFGELVEHDAVRWDSTYPKPGYYKVAWAPWTEEGTPHPLGSAAREAERTGAVWVPHTRVQLLADLAVQGRWPELQPMPAWIAEHRADMARWATHVNNWRKAAIDSHGRDSEQYRAVKEGYSMALSLMLGHRDAGQGSRTWDCDVHRPDWTHTIQDMSACNMWRWCDDLRALAVHLGRPELAPVAIMNKDELWVPEAAVEVFTTTDRLPTRTDGRPRRPLRIDETGCALGTWKWKTA